MNDKFHWCDWRKPCPICKPREKFIDLLLAITAGILLALGSFYGLDHQLQIEERYSQRDYRVSK